MYVIYDHTPASSPPDMSDQIVNIIASSYAHKAKIEWSSPNEKQSKALFDSVINQIPQANKSYNARTFMWTLIGSSGGLILDALKSLSTQGLLKHLTMTKVVDLELNITTGRGLSWIAPVYGWNNPKVEHVKVEWKEEEFFNKPVSNTELTPETIRQELAGILGISVDNFRILTDFDLKRVYRQTAMKLHPDRNNGDGSKMAELNMYWRLWDEHRRAQVGN